MKAARVLRFGPPSVITNEDVPQPEPGARQLLVRVKAVVVGNWVRSAYFYVDVTTARLNRMTELFDRGKLVTDVGTVLPLKDVRMAHEMLAGRLHRRGKIVLDIDTRM